MPDASRATDEKSLENLAFVHWLRTGQSLSVDEIQALHERKYNHNHDELGRFASSGGGVTNHSAMFHAPPRRTARSDRTATTTPHAPATPNRRAPAPPTVHSRQTARPAQAHALQPHSSLQRTHSTLRLRSGEVAVDQRFVAIGNYNFGVYAAASGMSLNWALRGAGVVYLAQTRNGMRNSKNESLIVSGYRDYMSGNVGD